MTLLDHGAPSHEDVAAPTPPAPERRPGHRLGGRRIALHPAWLVVAASCALLVRATVRTGLNTDVFWHLAAGNWMLSHHSVIRHDLFSYTVHGRPWLAEEWGFEVVLAWMVHHVGPTSYWLLSGGACVLALLATVIRARLLGGTALWTAALSIPLAFALLMGLAPRPQDLSYLLFALELLVLTLARRRRAALALLPVLFLVWSNVHGSFLAGLGMIALEVALAFGASRVAAMRGRVETPPAQQWRVRVGQPLAIRDASVALVASALVTLVNPHGIRLWSYAASVTTAPQLNAIEEWQSPNFHSPLIIAALGVPMLAVVVALATGRVRSELFDLLVWVGFTAASLHALRFIPYMGVAFAGLAAPWSGRQGETIRRTMLTWPAALVVCGALLVGGHRPAGALQPGAAPVASVDWLAHRGGRVFSTYGWNDYLIARHVPVFVDGRTDLYFGTRVLSTYDAVASLVVRPDATFRRWRIRWVIWPAKTPLSNYLAEDPAWRLVRRFGTQEIFEQA